MVDTEKYGYLLLTERLDREQSTIHEQIEEWRRWWKELEEYGTPRLGEMGNRLEQVHELLSTHFRQEEADRCFQKVAESCEEKKVCVGRLFQAHAALLQELRTLAQRCGSYNDNRIYWGQAGNEFEEFLKKLEVHEREENELIASSQDILDE